MRHTDANNNEIGPSITTSSAYSSDGNYLATSTDALGNTTTYSYNEAVGLLNYVVDANNNRISYLYDRYHSLSALFADTNGDGVFDAAEQGVRYVYDTWLQYTYNRNGIRTGKNFYDTVRHRHKYVACQNRNGYHRKENACR